MPIGLAEKHGIFAQWTIRCQDVADGSSDVDLVIDARKMCDIYVPEHNYNALQHNELRYTVSAETLLQLKHVRLRPDYKASVTV